ncbi:hypothetical protein [Rhodanobacter lindaniclasticus]
MRRLLLLGLCLLATLAHAAATLPARDAVRYRAVTDPHGLIAELRQQLDQRTGSTTPKQERDLLWQLGVAAVNANDDTALTEAVLRLDSLASVRDYTLAAASAGFLRARQKIARGDGNGVSEALRAAAKVQDESDPEIVAWARYNLCDAYAMSGKAHSAMPLCEQAQAAYRATGDIWGLAQAENDQGVNHAALEQPHKAIEYYQRSRQHFASIGAGQMAVDGRRQLGADVPQGGPCRRGAGACLHGVARWRRQEAAGRVSDALISRANIALNKRRWDSRGRRCPPSTPRWATHARLASTAWCPTCWNGAASCGRRPASCVWRWRMRANRSACSASATPPRKAPMRPRWRRATPPARRSCASAPWSTRIACRSWR